MEILDRLLPIFTLLLGSLLGWFLQRTESAHARRLAAGEVLAELRRYVWKKGGEDDWLNLQVFLGRLRAHLRGGGVPEEVILSLSDAAEAHWSAVEEEPHVGWAIITDDSDVVGALNRAEERVHFWLRPGWAHFWDRRKIKRQLVGRIKNGDA